MSDMTVGRNFAPNLDYANANNFDNSMQLSLPYSGQVVPQPVTAGRDVVTINHSGPANGAKVETAHHESFSFGRFGGALFKGSVVNTLKGIFSVEGLVMAGGALALTVATGGAAVPFLLAAGIGIGTFQAGKGAVNILEGAVDGNVKQVYAGAEDLGGGAAGVGLSIVGAKSFYKAGGKIGNTTLNTTETVGLSEKGFKGQIFEPVKLVFKDIKNGVTGNKTRVNAAGQDVSMYEATAESVRNTKTKVTTWWNDKPPKQVSRGPAAVKQAEELIATDPNKADGPIVNSLKAFIEKADPAQKGKLNGLTVSQLHAQATALEVNSELASLAKIKVPTGQTHPPLKTTLADSYKQGLRDDLALRTLGAEETAIFNNKINAAQTLDELQSIEAALQRRALAPNNTAFDFKAVHDAVKADLDTKVTTFKQYLTEDQVEALVKKANGDPALLDQYGAKLGDLQQAYRMHLQNAGVDNLPANIQEVNLPVEVVTKYPDVAAFQSALTQAEAVIKQPYVTQNQVPTFKQYQNGLFKEGVPVEVNPFQQVKIKAVKFNEANPGALPATGAATPPVANFVSDFLEPRQEQHQTGH